LADAPEDGGSYDLVVVGGGIAGTAAAISAARNGLPVALIQDRPVLGGNGSSEVRVWPEGKTRQAPFPHVGEIVDELVPAKGRGDGHAKGGAIYADERKLAVVRAEKRITLLTEQRVTGVVADHEVAADGKMGSSNLWNVLDVADPVQVLKCKDKDALSLAIHEGAAAVPFPRCPWAVDLSTKPFPRRSPAGGKPAKNLRQDLGAWFWESGCDRDPVTEIEYIRDLNLRAMYGAWDTLKNVDKLYPNHRLGWAAYIAGKRESRRLLGDMVLTGKDFREGTPFPDGCFPCSWHIDIHTPDPAFDKGHPKGDEFTPTFTHGKEFTYKGPCWAPYRTLYSRNISNLFMAGRDISVNREGLGPVRVMKTCGMMGEIVGQAAALASRHHTTPRGVYQNHLAELLAMMARPGK